MGHQMHTKYTHIQEAKIIRGVGLGVNVTEGGADILQDCVRLYYRFVGIIRKLRGPAYVKTASPTNHQNQ